MRPLKSGLIPLVKRPEDPFQGFDGSGWIDGFGELLQQQFVAFLIEHQIAADVIEVSVRVGPKRAFRMIEVRRIALRRRFDELRRKACRAFVRDNAFGDSPARRNWQPGGGKNYHGLIRLARPPAVEVVDDLATLLDLDRAE